MRVTDGDPTLGATDSVELAVRRVLDDHAEARLGERAVLTGTWNGQVTPVVLAGVSA